MKRIEVEEKVFQQFENYRGNEEDKTRYVDFGDQMNRPGRWVTQRLHRAQIAKIPAIKAGLSA